MARNAKLVDVRQIGPKAQSERHISGRCSACGSVVLASLEQDEEPLYERLRENLDGVFRRHVSEHHASGVDSFAKSHDKDDPSSELERAG